MDNVRVAHVINSIGLGGVPEAVYQLLQSLRAGPHEHRLYVLRRHDPSDTAREERLHRLRSLGIAVEFTPASVAKLGVIDALAAWLQSTGADILHTHSYKPNIRGRLAGALLRPDGLRMVAHYHNQYDTNWQRDRTLALDRLLTRQTDQLIACSDAVRAHVIERLGPDPARILTIANGTDLARFSRPVDRSSARAALGLAGDDPAITLVGRISEQKGQEEAVRAMPAIARRWPGARLLLAGGVDDPARVDALQTLAQALGVDANVRLLGFVSDMPGLYAASDLLVAPSRWEGFGLMLVEAMAAGVPIVATRAGAIPEVVGPEAAVLVAPADPAALAGAIAQVLGDRALAGQLVAAGRRRAAEFSWERAGDRLNAVYDALSGPRRGTTQ